MTGTVLLRAKEYWAAEGERVGVSGQAREKHGPVRLEWTVMIFLVLRI